MKKIVVLLLIISSISYGKYFSVLKFSKKIASKNLTKITKVVKSSKYTKKLPDINIPKGISKEVATITKVANKIAKKGDFEDKLISNTAYPTDVIRQYAKYGDNYLDTLKLINSKAMLISNKSILKLKNKFKNMPNINIKSSQEFNDKFIKALKFTGKKGWQASKELANLAKKYPKSSLVTAAYAWYTYDPQGFLEKKEEILNYLSSTLKAGVKDVTKLTLEASGGVIDGIIETVKNRATFTNILGVVLFFVLFILWKLRSFIKQFFSIKLENRLKKEKQKGKYINDNEEGTF